MGSHHIPDDGGFGPRVDVESAISVRESGWTPHHRLECKQRLPGCLPKVVNIQFGRIGDQHFTDRVIGKPAGQVERSLHEAIGAG